MAINKRPDVIKINNKIINMSSLNKYLTNFYMIKNNNERIFELMNPENKLRRQDIFDTIIEYDKNVHKFNFDNFTDTIYKLCNIDKTIIFEKENILTFKKACNENDELVISKLRNALIQDLKTNVILLVSDDTVNPIDFYFDSIKSYDRSEIQGIKINNDGFINSNFFTLTAVINVDYIGSIMMDINNSTDVVFENLKNDINKSLWAAIIRDNARITKTEKLMSLLNLLCKSDFGFLNTSAEFGDFVRYSDEKLNIAIKDFIGANENEIKNLLLKNNSTDNDIISFISLISDLDLNPMNLLSIIEPDNYSINKILLSLKIIDQNEVNSFASSRTLMKTYEDLSLERATKVILIGRLLPLLFFTTFYINDGAKYRQMKKIDELFESTAHDGVWNFENTNGSINLNKIHFNNDEFYDYLRENLHNPLKTTKKIKKALRIALEKYSKELSNNNNE